MEVKPGNDPMRQATVIAEPPERGFGLTLGNALRRILMSSLQGAAITAVQIDNVLHEFSSVSGVREDVTDIVLNLKGVAIRMEVEGPKRLSVQAKGPGVVTAAELVLSCSWAFVIGAVVVLSLFKGETVLVGVFDSSFKTFVNSKM